MVPFQYEPWYACQCSCRGIEMRRGMEKGDLHARSAASPSSQPVPFPNPLPPHLPRPPRSAARIFPSQSLLLSSLCACEPQKYDMSVPDIAHRPLRLAYPSRDKGDLNRLFCHHHAHLSTCRTIKVHAGAKLPDLWSLGLSGWQFLVPPNAMSVPASHRKCMNR